MVFVLWIWSMGSLFLLSPDPAIAGSWSPLTVSSPQEYLAQGVREFQQGAFEQAILHCTEAAQLYEKSGDLNTQSIALTYLAQAYQSIGQYQRALKNLELALNLAEQRGDQTQIASVLSSFGNVYIATGPAETAHRYLTAGLGLAKESGNDGLAAVILNNLGNLFTSQEKYHEALDTYQESIRLAEATTNRPLAARARTNAARVSTHTGHYAAAHALLDRALVQMRSLSHSHGKAYGLINIGIAYEALRPHLPGSQELLLLHAYEALQAAVSSAASIGDRRAASYAWGHLGKLYETEHRYQEALQLTRRASFAAQQVHVPESLYRWQWQTGRLFKALGNSEEALSAYRRAVDTLQSIRQEMAIRYGKPRASFRESVGPLYFGLVDLLLQRAGSLPEQQQYEPYLKEAREVVELFKAAELQDYFQDDCVEAARSKITRLDIISQTAIVVYPILLPKRTELLVSLPSGLKRFTVPVGADVVERTVRAFRRSLQGTTRRYLHHAQRLYDWLIRPLEPDLASLNIDTLVFVPDGPLRTIPMAALHDGTQFLINKYAVATTPGLDLTDPRPIRRENMKILAVGLSAPVQGFSALPSVSQELEALQNLYGGTLLLNEDFQISNIRKTLRNEEFTLIHIASHGKFESDAERSFLLTFDEKLTMDQLTEIVGRLRFRDEPLELLTLSACETAVGDDQAALGLAGVAVKAGARSALATLWQISDESSAVLVAEFYRQLQDPSVSRAIALQRAQWKLLQDQRYQHPRYWSPFLLINNWL
jgi:CHAT domain-containing protein/Tfp pilus assembly protein PilF